MLARVSCDVQTETYIVSLVAMRSLLRDEDQRTKGTHGKKRIDIHPLSVESGNDSEPATTCGHGYGYIVATKTTIVQML